MEEKEPSTKEGRWQVGLITHSRKAFRSHNRRHFGCNKLVGGTNICREIMEFVYSGQHRSTRWTNLLLGHSPLTVAFEYTDVKNSMWVKSHMSGTSFKVLVIRFKGLLQSGFILSCDLTKP
jgi:hypothetical protein